MNTEQSGQEVPQQGNSEGTSPARLPSTRRRNKVLAVVAGTLFLFGGVTLWYVASSRPNDTQSGMHAASGPVQYTCPMHPQIIRAGPGVCPICSMELVPVADTGGPKVDTGSAHSDMIHLSDRGRLAADVRTVPAEYRVMRQSMQVSAGVDFNEATHKIVSARYAGRIERLFIDRTGESVRQGAPLMEIYSPELVTAQKDFLIASEAVRAPIMTGTTPDAAEFARQRGERDRQVAAAARKRLALLGMSEGQIVALERRGEVAYTVTVFSPLSGIVLRRGVSEGSYVSEGTTLLEIVDLSSVWVLANVYETDAYRIRPGMEMSVSGAALGGETLHGRVDYVYPTVDASTRTVKVRGVFANPRSILRPGMYITATLGISAGDFLAVPVSAVVRTGKRDMVYVEVQKGMFEGREIELGLREGDYYQVLRGNLKQGDNIVSEGGYLLDSEVQLSSSTSDPHAGMNMGGEAPGK